MLRFPEAGVKSDEVVADLEVRPGGDDGYFPPDSIDDQPVADSLTPTRYCLHGEPFK